MRLAALYSGGKDSTYAMYVMEQQGHDIPYLITILPDDPDSMMFHTPNTAMVSYIAEAMGRKLLWARATRGGELHVLSGLLKTAAENGVEGIVTGAIQSDYQFTRIDSLCHENGLRCFSPLWRKAQAGLLRDIVDCGIEAVVVATAAEGLGREHLGRIVDNSLIMELGELHGRYGVDVCGEGGEYETYTLNSPMHMVPLEITDSSIVVTGKNSQMIIRKVEKKRL